MPCEACNIQFTVFKRKKSCTECRRLYCSNCLTKNKERILCKRCVIFTTRPLSKIELLKLKAKDLIFYLQSKHISTTGCVEKEELVNLVLIHVDNNFSPDSQQSPTSISMGISDQSDEDPRSNPFDQIRNTCQNLFTTFTEKIATDFNFDFKQNQSDRHSNVCEDQPRYSDSFRNIPSFNSNLTNNATSTSFNNSGNVPKHQKTHRPTTIQTSSVGQSTVINALGNSNNNHNITASGASESDATNTLQKSPTITGDSPILKSISSEVATTTVISQSIPSNEMQSHLTEAPSLNASTSIRNKPLSSSKITELSNTECGNDSYPSGCECSDDELIVEFRGQNDFGPPLDATTMTGLRGNSTSSKLQTNIDNNPTTILATSLSSPTKLGNNIFDSTTLKVEKQPSSVVDSLNSATFDDSGAVGGLQTDIASNHTNDKWRNINQTWNIDNTASTSFNVVNDASISHTTNLPNSITELPQVNHKSSNQSHNTQLEETIESNIIATFPQQHSTTTSVLATQQQQRNTVDMRSKFEKTLKSRRKMDRKITRRQSDGIVYAASTSNFSLQTVRSRGNTNDNGDDDDEDRSTSTSEETSSHKRVHKSICRKCGKTRGDQKKFSAVDVYASNEDTDDNDDDSNYDLSVGIHVYGSNIDTKTTSTHSPRQFFDLSTIERKEKLEELSVKQLKEVLMLNRVDFKGCCEKSELLERVQRLWDDRRNCPAVDKLSTVDLCKICMDAAIECVLLECGHMATCTNCGKVLSECPICRQYIVRVVRFFKA